MVFYCLDRDNSGKLDLIEFLKLAELSPFDIINNRKLNVVNNKFLEYNYHKELERVIRVLKELIRREGKTKIQFFESMELEGGKQISQKQLF